MTVTPVALIYPVVHDRDGYQLIEEAGRVSAVTPDGVEIAGAHEPCGHEYWSVHVSATAVRAAHMSEFPRHIHYHGINSRHDAQVWVEFIAGLFTAVAS